MMMIMIGRQLVQANDGRDSEQGELPTDGEIRATEKVRWMQTESVRPVLQLSRLSLSPANLSAITATN